MIILRAARMKLEAEGPKSESNMEFLKNLKDKNPRKVIYCEKVWAHREDLSQFGDIRPMLVPFNLK